MIRASLCRFLLGDRELRQRLTEILPTPVGTVPKREMSFGKCWLELDRSVDGGLSQGRRCLRSVVAVEVQGRVGHGEASLSQRETRVQVERAFEHLHREPEVFL